MEQEIQQLIQAIHQTDPRLVYVAAGAGTQALSDLLGVAGATRTLLEAIVPYSKAAFTEFLGQKPQKYVTPQTARLLAGRAFTRARWLEDEQFPSIGLACTATIVTDRPKRGEHRAFITTWQADRMVQYDLFLAKGARDRSGEESLVSRVILNALSAALNLEAQLSLPLGDQDLLKISTSDFAAHAHRLTRQSITHFGISANGRIIKKTPTLILSGAFNPLHDGHLGLAQAAGDVCRQPVSFECAALNVDKPALSTQTILERMAQFAGRWPVYASNAPTYVEKSRLYPQATFVVGYDTAARIIHPRYYQNSQQQLAAALQEIEENGCRFLVAGRVGSDGVFRDRDHLKIPPAYNHLFHTIPAEKFRVDISSTELRAQGLRGSR